MGNRLIVLSNCLWVIVAAWQAIKLRRKISLPTRINHHGLRNGKAVAEDWDAACS